MTTQDYINEELALERKSKWNIAISTQLAMGWLDLFEAEHGLMCRHPPEVILLRAKVRELTDKLAGERGRCAAIAREMPIAAVGPFPSGVRGLLAQHVSRIAAKIRSGK